MTPRRIAFFAVAVVLIVAGHFVGGFAGAGVMGAGIGIGVVGMGRREPYLLRRHREDEPDDEPRRWPEW